jgi:hypothetical protein
MQRSFMTRPAFTIVVHSECGIALSGGLYMDVVV